MNEKQDTGFQALLSSAGTNRQTQRPGQSLVEFAILLPLLLMMLSGLIEFGFALNVYLDLVDVSREVARFSADDDPIHDDASGVFEDFNEQFYLRAANMAAYTLGQAGQVTLDPNADDLVVSVFTVEDSGGTPVVTNRYPSQFNDDRGECAGHLNGGDDLGWRLNCKHPSKFHIADVNSRLATMGSSGPPDTGLVLVELFYDYHMVLGLPWIKAFVPDPITLHAYTFAPNPRAEP